MKYLVIFLLLPVLAFSQNKPATSVGRGVSPLETKAAHSPSGSTYAVVVGISDYQDKDIPDLRFADKDAEAFANFLRSPAGGSLDVDHLKLLTNKEATMGQFAAALDWLWEVSKEGDLAIIYFSGHGDVEKKSITQPGYLLCWDAPSRVYMGGGAFALPMFQDVVTTLSAQNKAKVVVITDACRSGKLAGSSVGGTQVTGSNLARQYANEIKILSCQPEEYSIEGEQWGGGRGAFSYNLVNALYGMADGNNDLSVTLQEVGRYLEDHVTPEVAPVSQVPLVLGNRSERLATVDDKLLSALRSGKASQIQMLSPIETRGMEDDVLAQVDSTTREVYRLFKKALKDKVFLSPATACADLYYGQLIQESRLARLHNTLTRNYAAALQDDAQQVMNKFMKIDSTVFATKPGYLKRFQLFPRYLERAAELLGPKHYMYASLLSRKFFFEGFLLAWSNQNPDKILGTHALEKFRAALELVPEQALVYNMMSSVFADNFREPDSMEYYALRAIELQPLWTIPYETLVSNYLETFGQLDKAKFYLDQASKVDSNSVLIENNWGIYYYRIGNYLEAERHYKRAIQLNFSITGASINLGMLYLDLGRYDEAESIFNKVTELSPDNEWAYKGLGASYILMRRYREAETNFKKSIQLDSMFHETHVRLGELYFITDRITEAEAAYKKAIQLDPTWPWGWYFLVQLYFATGRMDEAMQVAMAVVKRDSSQTVLWQVLASVHNRIGQYEQAEACLRKGYMIDSVCTEICQEFGYLKYKQGRYGEATQWCQKAISYYPTNWWAQLYLALISYKTGKKVEAFERLEQSIRNGAYVQILNSFPDLAPLRMETELWKTLMKKYFPDKFKD